MWFCLMFLSYVGHNLYGMGELQPKMREMKSFDYITGTDLKSKTSIILAKPASGEKSQTHR